MLLLEKGIDIKEVKTTDAHFRDLMAGHCRRFLCWKWDESPGSFRGADLTSHWNLPGRKFSWVLPAGWCCFFPRSQEVLCLLDGYAGQEACFPQEGHRGLGWGRRARWRRNGRLAPSCPGRWRGIHPLRAEVGGQCGQCSASLFLKPSSFPITSLLKNLT